MLQEVSSNKWYKFPLDIVRKEINELLENVPPENWVESWIYVKESSIVAIRPFIDEIDGEDKITGSLIYLEGGENFGINIMPSNLRKLLNISPIKTDDYQERN